MCRSNKRSTLSPESRRKFLHRQPKFAPANSPLPRSCGFLTPSHTISDGGRTPFTEAGAPPTPPPPPPPPPPTESAAEHFKRRLVDLFPADDKEDVADPWGNLGRKKHRRSEDIDADENENGFEPDSEDAGTLCGEDSEEDTCLDEAGDMLRGKCETEYGTETAFPVKKKLPTAARGTKSAEDRAQNDKAGGRPRGGKRHQNEDASTKNDRKQCRTHYKEGKATVAEILSRLENGVIMKKPELRAKVEAMGLNFDGMMKWYQEQTSSKKTKPKTTPMQFPRSETELRALFRGPEEKSHPWLSSVHIIQEPKEVLWRVYDHASQGVIRDQDIGIVAGGCANLNSVVERKKWLALHADWGNRTATPFISFGSSLEHIQSDPPRLDHIVARAAKKKPADTVMITQVNVNARLEEGRPILNALTELRHYCRESVYAEKLYGNEMLLPFQVHPEEIVWNWNWKHIKKWMNDKDAFNDITKWENAVAKPAYQVHEQARLEGKTAKMRRKAVNDFLQGNMKYAALIEEDL